MTQDPSVEQAKDLVKVLCLKTEDFDPRGDCSYIWNISDQDVRGGLNYMQPNWNWVRIGLKCAGRYDKGNNDWLKMNGNPKEWAIGFHGTSNEATTKLVKTRRFEVGTRHACQDDVDINKSGKNYGKKCGQGVYFADDVEDTVMFRHQAEPNDMDVTCALQVHIP